MPSDLLYDRFGEMPWEARIFPCPLDMVESVQHMILSCPFYEDLRLASLGGLFVKWEGWADADKTQFILLGTNEDLIAKVVSFLISNCQVKEESIHHNCK